MRSTLWQFAQLAACFSILSLSASCSDVEGLSRSRVGQPSGLAKASADKWPTAVIVDPTANDCGYRDTGTRSRETRSGVVSCVISPAARPMPRRYAVMRTSAIAVLSVVVGAHAVIT